MRALPPPPATAAAPAAPGPRRAAGAHARRALLALLAAAGLPALLGGCQHAAPAAAAREPPRPASLLVLPPLNDTTDVRAPWAVLAQVTQPLAEGGHVVLPVSLVDETFRQNGLQTAHDIHAIAPARLRAIFGAEAALYLQVKDYGPRYTVLRSETRVTLAGRLVDLRSGRTLWTGQASASSAEGDRGAEDHWLVTRLALAIAQQVAASVRDDGARYAALALQRLLTPGVSGFPAGARAPTAR